MIDEPSSQELRTREWLVFWAVVTTFCSLVPTAYAAFISNSTALRVDLLRCGGEFVAILMSWLVLKQLSRQDSSVYNYGLGKLEQMASLCVAAALFASFLISFFTGIHRLRHPELLEGSMFGLVFSILAVFGNAFVWIKDYRFYLRTPSPVMESQYKLFRAKTVATVVVTISLGSGMIFAGTGVGLYCDPIGSLFLALFLLYSSYSMVSTSMPDLIDRSVDEKVQTIIMSTLVNQQHGYAGLEKIRTRRSGPKMFIDIFLSFDPNVPFHEVHACVMEIKNELRGRLGKAEVIVIPSIPG